MKIRNFSWVTVAILTVATSFFPAVHAQENEDFGALQEKKFGDGDTKLCLRSNDIKTIARSKNHYIYKNRGNVVIIEAGHNYKYATQLSGTCIYRVGSLEFLQAVSKDGYICEYEKWSSETTGEVCGFGAFFDNECSDSIVSDRIKRVIEKSKFLNENDYSAAISLLDKYLDNGRALCKYDRSALHEIRGDLNLGVDFKSLQERLRDYSSAFYSVNLKGADRTRVKSKLHQAADDVRNLAKTHFMCSDQRKASYSGLTTLPLVRIPVKYSKRCLSNGNGRDVFKATAQFDVSESGKVENACIVETTNPCYNLSINSALSKWKFSPKNSNQKNVRNTFEYQYKN